MLVVLPDRKKTRDLLGCWESGTDDEEDARAVLYVAATRAMEVLGFAVPAEFTGQLATLVQRHNALIERHPPIVGPRRARVASSGRKRRRPVKTNQGPTQLSLI